MTPRECVSQSAVCSLTHLSLSSSSHPLSLRSRANRASSILTFGADTHTRGKAARYLRRIRRQREEKQPHTAGVRRINRPIISTYVCAIIESGINSRLLVSVRRTRKTNGAECERTAGLCVRQCVFRSLCALWCAPAFACTTRAQAYCVCEYVCARGTHRYTQRAVRSLVVGTMPAVRESTRLPTLSGCAPGKRCLMILCSARFIPLQSVYFHRKFPLFHGSTKYP